MVVKTDIFLNGVLHLLGRMKGMEIETLSFKMTEEILHTCVVPAVSLSGHTGLDTVSLDQLTVLTGGILESLVAV
ncbi:hypothetical protein D3C87_1581580 [compost metagenome]